MVTPYSFITVTPYSIITVISYSFITVISYSLITVISYSLIMLTYCTIPVFTHYVNFCSLITVTPYLHITVALWWFIAWSLCSLITLTLNNFSYNVIHYSALINNLLVTHYRTLCYLLHTCCSLIHVTPCSVFIVKRLLSYSLVHSMMPYLSHCLFYSLAFH